MTNAVQSLRIRGDPNYNSTSPRAICSLCRNSSSISLDEAFFVVATNGYEIYKPENPVISRDTKMIQTLSICVPKSPLDIINTKNAI
jgi:hypothetical protein